jgi:hypothetical protein
LKTSRSVDLFIFSLIKTKRDGRQKKGKKIEGQKKDRKRERVRTPVYFPPIYFETGYFINPVQETSMRDCIFL